MSSIWRSRKVPLVVGLKDGKVTSLAKWPEPKEEEEDVVLPYLEKEEELESFSVLGTDGRGRVVASRSGLKGLGKVVVLDLDEGLEKVEWKVVKIVKVSERGTFLSIYRRWIDRCWIERSEKLINRASPFHSLYRSLQSSLHHSPTS